MRQEANIQELVVYVGVPVFVMLSCFLCRRDQFCELGTYLPQQACQLFTLMQIMWCWQVSDQLKATVGQPR